ncbi:permease prefix domain 1-containing protein [Agromyces soli]
MTPDDQRHEQPDDLDARIASWRSWIERREAISPADVDELESHLRDQVDHLLATGLDDEEAFLVAVKRLGALDELSREYAREHSERLWKQLVLTDAGPGSDAGPSDAGPGASAPLEASAPPRRAHPRSLPLALALGVAAGLAVKAPAVVGVGLDDDPTFYLRNIGLLVLPFLAAYFAWRRRLSIRAIALVAGAFAAVALALDLYPFGADASAGTAPEDAVSVAGAVTSATELIAAAGALVVLWLAVGLAYAGGDWRGDRARMDFVRFSGEWFVYYVLIALGGGALSLLTVAVFASIGVDVMPFVSEWVLPCGAAGAVLVAAWLVEAKQRVIENIAPVLTKVFTPLFTLMMLALIAAALVQWNLVDDGRELLIAFDVVLVVVLALLVYSLSARDPLQPPGWFDRLQFVMLASALVLDAIVLTAMIGRIGEFGLSPNKAASLGLNLILLANLAGAAWLQLGFLRGRRGFGALERWQTQYLPAFLAWAAVLVFAFPPLFAFA